MNSFFGSRIRFLVGIAGTAIILVLLMWVFSIYSREIFLLYSGINYLESVGQYTTKEVRRNLEIPMPPPPQVNAIYITSPIFFKSEKNFDNFISLINDTELNSVVITLKSGGGIYKGQEGEVEELVRKLKEEGIYTIARLTVFQDNAFARSRPDVALQNVSGTLWWDSSGAYWVDPASRAAWDYNIAIAKDMIDTGFDELNLDYIRFPSDGDVSAIRYPIWDGIKEKPEVIKDFFEYFTRKVKKYEPKITLSADIFAYVFLSHVYDAGIGQRMEDAARYFDVVAPMVYPSHYSPGNFGFPNPAEYPYEVVLKTLEQGMRKLENMEMKKGIVRPWLQAFHMGARYDGAMVNLEKQAVLDAGFNHGWMLWNPNNRYPMELFDSSQN